MQLGNNKKNRLFTTQFSEFQTKTFIEILEYRSIQHETT